MLPRVLVENSEFDIPAFEDAPADVRESMRQQLRERCYVDTYFLGKAILGFKDFAPSPHGEMCAAIMLDRRPKAKRRFLGLVPRDHFKTSAWTITDSIRRVVKNPDVRILLGNETSTNASHFLRRIQAVWTKNVLFRWLFEETVPDFGARDTKWSETEMLVKRRGDYPEATIEAIGVGGAVVSRHYNLLKLDDLVGKAAGESPEIMKDTVGWYQYCESLLEDPVHDEIHVIGTRWTHNDLYRWILDNEGGDIEYYFRSCFNADGSALWPARFNVETLERLKRKLGTFKFSCNPAEAPILMADFSEKRIADVRVGDEVVGFTWGEGGQLRISKSRVKSIGSRTADVYSLRLASGKIIRCTREHKWFTGRYDKAHQPYLQAELDRSLLALLKPDAREYRYNDLAYWQYLAGIIDGEGAVNGTCVQITQSERMNPGVCRKIEATLDALSLSYETWRDERKDCLVYTLHGGRDFKIDLLRHGRPGKAQDIIENLWGKPGKPFAYNDKVVAIDYHGQEPVYALHTETGNYIAWGYASKNCQYLNDPRDPDQSSFDRKWLHFWSWDSGRILPRGAQAPIPLEMLRVFMRVDPAISERPGAARSAIVVDAVAPDGRIFLLEAWAKRCQPFEMIDKIFDLASYYTIDSIAIEAVAYQRILKPVIEAESLRRGKWLNIINVRPDSREKKENRIRGALQPYLERGLYWVREDMADWLEEYDTFPNGKTLDLVDATAYGPHQWFIPDETPEDNEDIAWKQEMEHTREGRSELTGY